MSDDVIVVEEGKVLDIASSDTKNGGKIYRIEVEDLETGDVDWFGAGFDEPEFGADSIVSFEFEENGKYLNIVDGSLEVIDLVEPEKKKSSRGSRGSSRSSKRSGGKIGRAHV